MKKGILALAFVSFLSCMPEEELPMKDMGDISGYFIECYCKPGEFYTLNAAKISPISEIIDLDTPVELDVSIKADTVIKLQATPTPTFLGNFRHDTKFNQYGLDSLYLSIYPPQNEHITAKTAIPDNVTISSHVVSKATNSVTINFSTSRNPVQNYYIYSVQARKNGSGDNNLLKKETVYLDLSHNTGGVTIEKTIRCQEIEKAEAIVILLLRITEECYNYQISLYEANSANQGSITSPVPLVGNIQGALGIFTCYTEDYRYVLRNDFE